MSAQRSQRSTARSMEAGTSSSSHVYVDPPTVTIDSSSDTDDSLSEVRRRKKRAKKPLTDEEMAKKRRIPIVFNQLRATRSNPDGPYRPTSIPQECGNCSKDFDDIVRQVHSDLKAGRLVMIDVLSKKNTVPVAPETPKTHRKKVQTSECMAHCDGCQCHLPMDQRTPFQRDFSGGTMSTKQCQCKECVGEGKVLWVKSTKPPGQVTYWKKASYRTRRSHAPCEDEALQDLHNNVLAGNQTLPGDAFVKILDSLHGQGPCIKECKLKADVVWMKKNVPKEVGTQTIMYVNKGVQTDRQFTYNKATQTNRQKSVGTQKGSGLAQIRKAMAAWYRTSGTSVRMLEVPDTHRPVSKVASVQSVP